MKRNIFFYIGIILALVPGIVLTISTLTTDIQGISPFSYTALLIMIGTGIVFLGLAIAIIAGIKSPARLIVVTVIFILHFLFIPINNSISNHKIKSFIENNIELLDKVSTGVFISEISVEEANAMLDSEDIPIEQVYYDSNQQIVYFLIDGIQDNCHGIATRFNTIKPLNNPCGGQTDVWEEVRDGWFIWSSI